MTAERMSLSDQIEALQFALSILLDPRKLTDEERRYWLPRLGAALESLRLLEFGRATLG